jgi:hypothetical protein
VEAANAYHLPTLAEVAAHTIASATGSEVEAEVDLLGAKLLLLS